jgi:hypothetical protein
LLVRRDLSTLVIKEGEKLTVTVEVHNAGSGEATDVSVSDTEWDSQLFTTTGDISATFDTIPAGTTKAYSFSVVPSVPLNRFEQPELTISYTTNGKSVSSQGPKEYLKVHSRDEMLRRRILSAGAWLTLGAITDEETWLKTIVGIAGSVALYVGYSLVKGTKSTFQSAQRKRVLKEFGVKDE